MSLTSRVDVLNRLRNQTVRISGLEKAFNGWVFEVNPGVDQVRSDVDIWLESLFPNHPRLRKLKAGDYGLFGATWWPRAPLERLRIATFLSIWLFLWDDEIDSDAGSLADEFDLAQDYRSETLRYIRNRLGLDASGAYMMSTNKVIGSFDIIGKALRDSCPIEQRVTFMNEVSFFIEKSEVEQRLRLNKEITTIEEFWQYRLGTSAVRVVLCLNEYCNKTVLPEHVVQDQDVQALWDLTNANICNVNDLLSVKKELAQGSVESLVPILYATLHSAQAAVDQVIATVRLTIKEFDSIASRVLARFAVENPIIVPSLRKMVESCRFYCTGNLSWSLETGRYGVYEEMGQGEFFMKL